MHGNELTVWCFCWFLLKASSFTHQCFCVDQHKCQHSVKSKWCCNNIVKIFLTSQTPWKSLWYSLGSTMEKAMAPHSSTGAWKIPWMEEPGRLQSMGSRRVGGLSNFTFTFHCHALEKAMATHSSVLARRIPGTGEPVGLPSMESHRVGHDWSDLAAAAAGFTYLLV